MRNPFYCAGCGKALPINGDVVQEQEGNFCDAICRAFYRRYKQKPKAPQRKGQKPNPGRDQSLMFSLVFITLGLMSILNYFVSTFSG